MKVAMLLEHYPDLEETLLSLSPAFSKLTSPVLRKTLTRITSLAQAARVGGLDPGFLVRELRARAAQSPLPDLPESRENESLPPWASEAKPEIILDGRPLLEEGIHPLAAVMDQLKNLKPGDVFLLLTPFVPAPLIDKARERGFEACVDTENSEEIRTYFRHQP